MEFTTSRGGCTGSVEAVTGWHGTSSAAWSRIRGAGRLDRPFLAANRELAEYYAEVAADEDGSDPVVVRLVGVPTAWLAYDGAAMDEPVLATEASRDQAWDEAARTHPEWVRGEYVLVPAEAWRVSWVGVGSVRVTRAVPLTGEVEVACESERSQLAATASW